MPRSCYTTASAAGGKFKDFPTPTLIVFFYLHKSQVRHLYLILFTVRPEKSHEKQLEVFGIFLFKLICFFWKNVDFILCMLPNQKKYHVVL